ncbi:MAG: hypothetical protein LBU62_10090 [Bacteroidales bacterium]|jgi:YbbR domain-containing protein|nr:hypothetical protein [Bacteroidales bacterium]
MALTESFLRRFRQFFGKKSRPRHELMLYLFFLLIAVVIWYMNALNKDYITDLKFSTSFVDLPADKVMIQAPDDYVTLTVQAQGFTLLKYRLGIIFHPVLIKANYKNLKQLRKGKYYMLTSSVVEHISEQLSSDINLIRVMPDTLRFMFSDMVQKKVPVKVISQFQFEKEFTALGNIKVEPAEVTVSGPHAIIDTIRYIYAQGKTFKGLKDTLKAMLALQPVDLLSFDADEVHITLPVERVTEAGVSVSIEAINLPEGFSLKTFPGSISVNCMVPVSRFNKLQPQMFRAVVDYESITNSKESKAKVVISKSPDFVLDVRYHPKSVDFIVEK